VLRSRTRKQMNLRRRERFDDLLARNAFSPLIFNNLKLS
jgi:hypothetical protein